MFCPWYSIVYLSNQMTVQIQCLHSLRLVTHNRTFNRFPRGSGGTPWFPSPFLVTCETRRWGITSVIKERRSSHLLSNNSVLFIINSETLYILLHTFVYT